MKVIFQVSWEITLTRGLKTTRGKSGKVDQFHGKSVDLAILPRKAEIIHLRRIFNDIRLTLMGISNLAAYMADANAHIQLISDLFPHLMNHTEPLLHSNILKTPLNKHINAQVTIHNTLSLWRFVRKNSHTFYTERFFRIKKCDQSKLIGD